MSAVYKARDLITGKVVAIKILSPRDNLFAELVGEDRLRQIFVEEARIMGEIRHPHVAGIIDCDAGCDHPYIVLDYFPNSLGALILDSTRVETSRILGPDLAYRYISQTLRGLARLHRSGIIHRDIKPHNLMISCDDMIKIIDFGLCRIRGKKRLTIPGMQIGSPFYTAPEQERDPAEADERSDLYGVGATLYRLLSGRFFDPRHEGRLPSAFNNGFGEAWADFLCRSMARNPGDRYQSAVEMGRQLDEVYTCTKKSCQPYRTKGCVPPSLFQDDLHRQQALAARCRAET